MLYSFFSASKMPAGLALITVWKTMNYNYVRFVDHGVLTGVSEQIWRSWTGSHVVTDRIASSTDLMRLATTKRKRRASSINTAFDKVKDLASNNHTKLSSFLVIVEQDGQHLRHVSHGPLFQGEAHVDLSLRHTLQPGMDQDHCARLKQIVQQQSQQPWKLQEQMEALNCLPNLDVSFSSRTSKKMSVSEGRFYNSCKSLVIRGQPDVHTIHAAANSDHVFRRQGVPNDSYVCMDFGEEDVDDTCSLHEHSPSKQSGTRAVIVMNHVDKFKFLIRADGIVRVCRKSSQNVEIVWNKYDTIKGMVHSTLFSKQFHRKFDFDSTHIRR